MYIVRCHDYLSFFLYFLLAVGKHFRNRVALKKEFQRDGGKSRILQLSSHCHWCSVLPGAHHQADRLLHGRQSGHQLQCEERHQSGTPHQRIQRGTVASRSHRFEATEICQHANMLFLPCRNTPCCLTWSWCSSSSSCRGTSMRFSPAESAPTVSSSWPSASCRCVHAPNTLNTVFRKLSGSTGNVIFLKKIYNCLYHTYIELVIFCHLSHSYQSF